LQSEWSCLKQARKLPVIVVARKLLKSIYLSQVVVDSKFHYGVGPVNIDTPLENKAIHTDGRRRV